MEIERLVKDGVKEVMLLGQNVNSYGKNLNLYKAWLSDIDTIKLES